MCHIEIRDGGSLEAQDRVAKDGFQTNWVPRLATRRTSQAKRTEEVQRGNENRPMRRTRTRMLEMNKKAARSKHRDNLWSREESGKLIVLTIYCSYQKAVHGSIFLVLFGIWVVAGKGYEYTRFDLKLEVVACRTT